MDQSPTRHSAFAIRPRSKFQAWDAKWEVVRNNTLDMILELEQVDGPLKKRIRYRPTTQITCYSVPFHSR